MLLVQNFWRFKKFMLVTRCGTFPARVAQARVRLPPTLEADMPVYHKVVTSCSIRQFVLASFMKQKIVFFRSDYTKHLIKMQTFQAYVLKVA